MIELDLIKKLKETATSKFEELSSYTNCDEGYKMIILFSQTIHTRKINDWGREEDTDLYFGLDSSGWILYQHNIEHMVGNLKITNESVKKLFPEESLNYINSLNSEEKKEIENELLKIIDIA